MEDKKDSKQKTVIFFEMDITSMSPIPDDCIYQLFKRIDKEGIIYGAEQIHNIPTKIMSVLKLENNSVFGIVGKNEDSFQRSQRVEFDGNNISYPNLKEYKNYAFISYFYIDFNQKIGCYLSNSYNVYVDHIIRDTVQHFDQDLNININYISDSEENIENVKKAVKKLKKIKINLSNKIIKEQYSSIASLCPISSSILEITLKNKRKDKNMEYVPEDVVQQVENLNDSDKKCIIDYIGIDNVSTSFNLTKKLLSKKILVSINDSEAYDKDYIEYVLKNSIRKINLKK